MTSTIYPQAPRAEVPLCARAFRRQRRPMVAHLPSFFSSALHIISPLYPQSVQQHPSLPQLHRKVLIRVIVVPALLPQMRIAVRDLRLLLCPVFDGEVLELVVLF